MNQKSSVKVLDCTLRDGGYYNNWDFSLETVNFYLQSLEAAKVDIVEIGFRSLPQKNRFFGAFAYTTDDFLATLDLPKSMKYGVMINAKDYLQHPAGAVDALDITFQERSKSPVALVRIAAHFAEVPECGELTKKLKALGYEVGLNVMQAGGKSSEALAEAAQVVQSWDSVDALYFADSLGNMQPADVQKTLEAFRQHWKGELGIHAHNNMGQALSNSLTAVQQGATWIDATVLGMGRGAGNTCLENLLLELNREGHEQYDAESVFPLVIEAFTPMKEEYNWGPNLLYYLSAVYGVHPTYIQEMLKYKHYKAHHILAALDFLKKSGGNSYSTNNLQNAVHSQPECHEGSWSAKDWAKDQDVLIVGPGPSTGKHLAALEDYISRKSPIVLSLNINPYLAPEKVTAYMACHRTRLLLEADKYSTLKRPIIVPLGVVPNVIRTKFEGLETLDYGLDVQPGQFEVDEKSCVVPFQLVIAYALALSVAGNANRVLLAGFDGYGPTDPRQDEMIRLLNLYNKQPNAVPLLSVTPTTYPLEKSSIYSPEF